MIRTFLNTNRYDCFIYILEDIKTYKKYAKTMSSALKMLKSVEMKSPKKYFSYFVLTSSLGLEPV